MTRLYILLSAAFAPFLLCSTARAETLPDRIRGIEAGIQGEPPLLAADSKLQLAELLIQRSPKDAARILQDAISLLSGLDSEVTRSVLSVRATTLLARVDLPRALQVIDSLPLSSDSDADLFSRDHGYSSLLTSGTLPASTNLVELSRRALQASACPIAQIQEQVEAIRESLPSDATLLTLELAACIRNHKANARFVNDALQFIRANPALPQEVAAGVLESLIAKVENPAFTAGPREGMTGTFRGGSGKRLEVRELLRMQIAALARERVPTVFASLESRVEYGNTRKELATMEGTLRPTSVTHTLPVAQVAPTDGLAAARAESKALAASERLPYARRQQSVEVRVALLFDVLNEDRLPEDERDRLAAELAGELSKTRPGYTRALRAQALLVKGAAWQNERLVTAAALALTASVAASCRCDRESCTSFETRTACLDLAGSAAKAMAPHPAAREAAGKADASLRTRFALLDLPGWMAANPR